MRVLNYSSIAKNDNTIAIYYLLRSKNSTTLVSRALAAAAAAGKGNGLDKRRSSSSRRSTIQHQQQQQLKSPCMIHTTSSSLSPFSNNINKRRDYCSSDKSNHNKTSSSYGGDNLLNTDNNNNVVPLESFGVITEDEKEIHKIESQLEHKHAEFLHKSRSKTYKNVRRALVGNLVIASAKFAAWAASGSSAMLSEFVHSLVDSGNQALLLIGLRDSNLQADKKHPYGYGKSIYFWSLVSALGTFWLGAGVSMGHSIENLISPQLHDITWQVWSVLGFSFAVDGYVLYKTVDTIRESTPSIPISQYYRKIRDPATLAVLLEDGAACAGVIIAGTGIVASHYTGLPIFDGLAGVGVSALLAGMGFTLARMNQHFLLGQTVDSEILAGIEKILLKQPAIDNVHSVQSQWTGPDSFSYKAEVDFDGTYLAAKLLPRYQKEFYEAKDTLDKELRVLLSWYAEDVMRALEREVRQIEAEVRKEYPEAQYIELEPDSKDSNRFAIDDGMEAALKRIEIESLNRMIQILTVKKKTTSTTANDDSDTGDSDNDKDGGSGDDGAKQT